MGQLVCKSVPIYKQGKYAKNQTEESLMEIVMENRRINVFHDYSVTARTPT